MKLRYSSRCLASVIATLCKLKIKSSAYFTCLGVFNHLTTTFTVKSIVILNAIPNRLNLCLFFVFRAMAGRAEDGESEKDNEKVR